LEPETSWLPLVIAYDKRDRWVVDEGTLFICNHKIWGS